MRKRPGRAGSRPRASHRAWRAPTRPRCSRPSSRSWRSATTGWPLHGEVVEGLSGEGATSICRFGATARSRNPLSRREGAVQDERHDAFVRRRTAGLDAGAAGDGGADHQFVPPAHPGLLGADLGDLGRREPHDRAAGDTGLEKSTRVEFGSPPRMATLTWPLRLRWAPACGASRTSSSWANPSRETPMTGSTLRSSTCRAR